MYVEVRSRASKRTRRLQPAHLLFLCLTLSVLVALAGLWAGRSRPFQEIARPVCTVREWQNETIYPSFSNYYWISDSELLIRSNPNALVPTFYRQRISAIAQPSPLIASTTGHGINEDVQAVSPDGKWAACVAQGEQNTLKVVALNGSRTQSWTYPYSDSIMFWMPDSRRFVVIGSDPKHASQNTTTATIYSLGSSRPEAFLLPALPNATANSTGFVGFTSSGNAVFQLKGPFFMSSACIGSSPVNYPWVSLIEIDLNHHVTSPPRLFSLRAPKGLDLGMLALSPKGDRIFWGGFAQTQDPLWHKWLNRWIPSIKSEQRLLETGWISNADGSHLHELGCYEIPGDASQPVTAPNRWPAWILEPRWSPDGKFISVLFNDSVYTVPVD